MAYEDEPKNGPESLQVGVSNVLGWVKRLWVKRVTGEKHVNPNTTRLLNVLNGLTRLSPEPV